MQMKFCSCCSKSVKRTFRLTRSTHSWKNLATTDEMNFETYQKFLGFLKSSEDMKSNLSEQQKKMSMTVTVHTTPKCRMLYLRHPYPLRDHERDL